MPVIVLSVRDSETEKVLTLDSGANHYVTKPFGIREFLAPVRNLLRARPDPTVGKVASRVASAVMYKH